MSLVSTKTADQTVKFLSTTVGRDRINRFVQYLARYLVWHGQRTGYSKETIDRLSKLMTNVAQTRKLMRVGRQVEFANAIQKASTIKDDIIRKTTQLKQLFLAVWIAHDSLQWAHTAGVYTFTDIKTITRRGLKFWLAALVVSTLGNLHRLRMNTLRMTHEQKAIAMARTRGVEDADARESIRAIMRERQKIMWATVQDGLDILIPASGLEYVNVESGILGLIGMFTSVLGGWTHWNSL
ncbi:Peroxisomal membrane protein PMP27 [Rhizophlyctis rosea]|nr:Peroxisomal membrane protein PMP27 [Rhizophlyctis rosea]